MKIVIIYSQVAPNLYEILFSVEHKKKVLCYPLTPIEKKKKYWSINGFRQLSGYQHSSKYNFLCSAEERVIQVWSVRTILMTECFTK